MYRILLLLFLALSCHCGVYQTAYWEPTPKPATVITWAKSNPVIDDSSLTNGLIVWYKMDENSWDGTSGEVKDSSGQNLNATSFGSAQTNPGKINRSGYFNGTTGRIQSESPLAGDLTNNFTVMLWFKTSTDATQRLVCKRYGTCQYDFYFEGGYLAIYDGSSAIGNYSIVSKNQWHHIGFQISNNVLSFFLDGNQTFPGGIAPHIVSGSELLGIGSFPNAAISPVNGAIDDVRIYNRVLGSNEVYQIFNATLKENKPIAIYQGSKLVYNPHKKSYKKDANETEDSHNEPQNSIPPIPSPLISWFKLDDVDSQGPYAGLANVNTIDVTAPGKSGTCLHFDGYSDGVTCSPASMVLTSFTINLWVNLDTMGAWTRFVAKGAGGYSTTFVIGQSGIDGSIYFGLFDGSSQYACYFGTPIPTGEWAMITGTWDGITLKTYLNGVFQAQADFTGTLFTSEDPLFLGTSADGPSYNLTGYLDEVKIYNTGMTETEVNNLFLSY